MTLTNLKSNILRTVFASRNVHVLESQKFILALWIRPGPKEKKNIRNKNKRGKKEI